MGVDPNPPPSEPDDQEKTSIRSDPRFWIATILIAGMLFILVLAEAQGQYAQITQLVAIFSGWVTSIIAFYFYTQSNTQLQNQIKTSANAQGRDQQKANDALIKAHTAEKKVSTALALITGSETTTRNVTETDKAKAAPAIIEKIKAILQQEET